MKKIISIILCVVMMATFPCVSNAQYEDSVSRVCAIGIMGNVSDGNFRHEDNITRAEFTTVVMRMLGMSDISLADTKFSDVEFDHWASGYIKAASDLGLINGRGNSTFSPEDNVTYNEAVKIIVCALGRELAMVNHDYPVSYISEGESIGLTKGLSSHDRNLTREEVAALIDNALDLYPIEPVYGTGKYTYAKRTVYGKLALLKETSLYTGVLTQCGHICLDNTLSDMVGYVYVDSIPFRTDEDYTMYAGQLVDVYYSDNGSVKNVVHLAPRTITNKIYTLGAVDTYIQDGKIYYINENDKEKHYNLESNFNLVVNGEKTTPGQRFSINLGDYQLIDNNGNGNIDVVLVTKAESFVVESVSEAKMSIYFDNNRTYHARGGIALDYEDREYEIIDSDGEKMELSSVEPGDAVSIAGNSDDSYIKLIINKGFLAGSITGLSDDEIIIDDKSYKIGKDQSGNPLLTPYLGMEGNFVLDAFGYCVGTFGNIPDRFTYGYITDATRTQSMDATLKLKIITGTEPVKDVKITGGDEVISYHLQNDEIKIYTLADTVKYKENPIDAVGEKMNSSNLDPAALREKIIGYTLNSDGQINALNIYTVPANLPSYEFNADIFSFGGIRVTRGFVRDEGTNVVCVPRTVRDEKDYDTRVTITDKTNVTVYGIKGIYDNDYGSEEANSEPVDIIIVKADMDSSMPPIIPVDNNICIIGKITSRLSSDGDEVCTVQLLNGSEKETYDIPYDSHAFSQAKTLRKGDLIQFALNSRREISSVRKLASVQGLEEYTDAENVYGIIDDVKFNVYDHYTNSMIDRLKVNVGSNDIYIKLYKENGQNIYLYDRASGYIYPATSDDIMASSYYGEGATKVFAYMDEHEAEAKVVVLIKD